MNKIKKLIVSWKLRLKYTKKVDKDCKVGTKLIVVSDSENHKIPLGSRIIPSSIHTEEVCTVSLGSIRYLRFKDVRIFESSISDIKIELKTAEDEVKQAEQSILEIKHKLEFMKESGCSTFNENEFKAYQALNMLNNVDLSTFEKAKKIANIFKQ